MTESLSVPAPPASAPPPEPWASWGRRALALLLDIGLQLPFIVVSAMIGSVARDPDTGTVSLIICGLLSLVVTLASLVFSIWNSIVRQGRKGASLGKQACGILVLSLNDARPVGALTTFIRSLMHVVDVLSLGVGYLWPLWDTRRQTFADKIMNTGVLYLPDVRF
ncbi:MAG: RDD family protein [Marmoricola sp.]